MADNSVTPLQINSKEFSQLQKQSSLVVNQTYSWISNAGFYACVNPAYLSFYYNNVRRLAYWLDGWVPNFHSDSNGIFSTRFANSLVRGLGEAVTGREIMFRNVGKEKSQPQANADANAKALGNVSLKAMAEWGHKNDFQSVIKKAFTYALGLGTSCLKINIREDKTPWIDTCRLDRFYFEADVHKDIQDITFLLSAYESVGGGKDGKTTESFYLVEHRYYKYTEITKFPKDESGKLIEKKEKIRTPYVIYQVKKVSGTVLSNQNHDTTTSGGDMLWKSLPAKVREAIKKDYSIIVIGEEQELPMGDIGCYLLTCDDGNISLPATPFGTSVLENIVAYLMGVDISYSYFFRDMYQGKGMVIMPKFMQQPRRDPSTGLKVIGDDPLSGLEQSTFYGYDTTSQEKQQIEQVQFNLRGAEWSGIRNFLVENIALQLQISPRSIAPFLGDGGIRTATQVSSEDNNTISFIEAKRATMERPVNKMVDAVRKLLLLPDQVEIRFSKQGVTSQSELLAQVQQKMQMGVIDLRSALEEIMIDSDEDQITERYNRIMAEKQANAEAQLRAAMGSQLL